MKKELTIEKLREFASTVMIPGSKVWLYGSRARGDARPYSDWDLLVLLDKDKINDEDFDKYAYSFIVFGSEYQEEMSPLLYTNGEWDYRKITPFYQNVERDKMVIYGS